MIEPTQILLLNQLVSINTDRALQLQNIARRHPSHDFQHQHLHKMILQSSPRLNPPHTFAAGIHCSIVGDGVGNQVLMNLGTSLSSIKDSPIMGL